MDGWRDRSSFDDLVQSERAPARFTNLQKFSSDSNALASQGPRYDLHFFLFFSIRTTDRENSLQWYSVEIAIGI